MLYAKLFEDYLQLSKEDKRGKLKNILNRLGDQYDFYAETMWRLEHPDVSEEYLDRLYEALMKPLSKFKEKGDQIAQTRVLISQLNLSIKTVEDRSWSGAEEMLNHLSDL